MYADETQLYISFKFHFYEFCSYLLKYLPTLSLTYSLLDELEQTASQSIKTEFLLIGTKQQRLKFSDLTNVSLSSDIIPVSSSARNLGFIFDSDMSFSDQINSVSKSCHFHIRDIRRIRHLLHLSTATCSCKFSCLQQTWLLQFTILWHLTSKSQQTSTDLILISTCHYKHFKTSQQYSKNYTGFQSNKESITNSVFSHTKH